MTPKQRSIGLLLVAELLAMALWFSASAVVPQLTLEWELDSAARAWLTMSVQLGFVIGALASAWLNLADRIPAERLVAWSAALGAVCNGVIAVWAQSAAEAIPLRLLTGVCLAGVYPPAMKLVASWTSRDRGLGIGMLIGALTVGSASPHLINVLPFLGGAAGMPPWRPTLLTASASALLAALIAALLVRPGPLLPAASRFHWRHATAALTDRPTRLANLGYLGHMWELYAMWVWVPLLLLESYRRHGWPDLGARWAGFGAIAVGAVGCVVAGKLADRLGRTAVASACMLVSGLCCLLAGWLIDRPGLLTLVCLLWGVSVVADSAQFSAAVSELCEPAYVGTALTVQTSLGFLLTLVTIRMVAPAIEALGWPAATALLAFGPAAGIAAMLRLRSLPESVRMASGSR